MLKGESSLGTTPKAEWNRFSKATGKSKRRAYSLLVKDRMQCLLGVKGVGHKICRLVLALLNDETGSRPLAHQTFATLLHANGRVTRSIAKDGMVASDTGT